VFGGSGEVTNGRTLELSNASWGNAMKMSRSWLTALCLVGLGALFVVPALGISIGTLLTFLLVLACPLMHLFMMRGGHGGHGGHDHGAGPAERPVPDAQASVPTQEKKALNG
jgi:hypothetical protein